MERKSDFIFLLFLKSKFDGERIGFFFKKNRLFVCVRERECVSMRESAECGEEEKGERKEKGGERKQTKRREKNSEKEKIIKNKNIAFFKFYKKTSYFSNFLTQKSHKKIRWCLVC